ncbi:MAG: PAS domain-containing protein [Acidobacteria bacterium]|nr:PAS domain-containing protein [Acidobacteriota bacterium]
MACVVAAVLTTVAILQISTWMRPNPAVAYSFLFAIMAAAWWGGYAGGIFACALTFFAAPWLLFPNFSPARVDPNRLALTMLVSLLVSRVAAGRRQREALLRAANEELEKRVQERTIELTRANEALQREVEERAQAQEQLAVSEQRFRQLAESIRDVFYITDAAAGRVHYISPAYETIWGVPCRSLYAQPRSFLDSIHPADRPRVEAAVERQRGGQPTVEDYRITRPDGATRWIHDRSFPIFDSSGRLRSVVGVAADITDRKKIEEALTQQAEALARSNADLQEFAYVASHDLQEPLRNISSYAQILKARYPDRLDEDGREFLGYITAGVCRMNALITGLLALSRVIDRDAPQRWISAEEALGWARKNLESSIEAAKATITNDPLPWVMASDVQLLQVFQNLLENAMKYAKPGEPPQVHISAHPEEDACTFRVTDNGIGIRAEHHERIFGVFKRLHGQNVPGTGIGLALCKKIIERHHGRIWVESTPGRGSTFCFSLPAGASAAKAAKG